jgi:tetratricopeptide (TPR) repeat protein
MRKRLQIRLILLAFLLLCCFYQINAQQRERLKQSIDSLINLLPQQKDDSLKAEKIRGIATGKMDLALHTGNWDDPIEWTHKALNLSIRTNYKFGTGRCYWQLGMCWMKKANYPEAIKYFSEGLKTAYKNRNKYLENACNLYMASCYMSLGNYQEVIKISQSALENLRQMNSMDGSEEHYSMLIGNAYVKLHNYTEAMNWYEKLLKNHRVVPEDRILIPIASIQMEMKNYDAALKNYLAALRSLTSDKRLNEKPETEFNGLLGGLYMQIGEVYYNLGLIQQDSSGIHTYNQALNYLEKSLPLLKANAGGKETLMNAYALLKQVCEAINDYKNALRYSNLFTKIKDSIYNKTTYLKLADQQVKYETEKAAAVMNAKEELEKVRNEKLLADQKLEQEKILAQQKIGQERTTATKKAEFDKSLAAEKSRQEKINAEKQRTNNLLLMGLIFVIISSGFLVLYLRQRQQKKRAIEKAVAVHKMAELEMQSLRSQLNPHFMFNSLNSLQRLILMEESDKSQSYLARFAKLLRMLLENADKPFIPLQKEIDFLQLYLGLEKLRVPDLQYSISTDPALNTDQTLVPNMILQPYVENAIWHGLSHKENEKQIKIRIYQENGTVNCEIEDNGVGRKKAEELKSLFRKEYKSKGMELLTKRFKLLNEEYGSDIRTIITDLKKNDEDIGVLVTIKVPVKLSGLMQN